MPRGGKKNRKKPRNNPSGITSMADAAKEMSAAGADAPELTGEQLRLNLQRKFPALKKLKVDNFEQLEEGCVALAAAFVDSETAPLMPQIARCGVVEELCEVASRSRLAAKAKAAAGTPANSPQTAEAMAEAQLVVVALGALRNMSMAGEATVVEMVRAGLVKHLLVLLQQAVESVVDPASSVTGVADVDKDAKIRAFSVIEHAAALAMAVAEASELGLSQLVYTQNFVEVTAVALNHPEMHLQAKKIVLQCYLILSDDKGGTGANQILSNASLEAFFSAALGSEDSNIHVRVLVAAVMYNLRGATALGPAEAAMAKALNFDVVDAAAKLLSILPPESETRGDFRLTHKPPPQVNTAPLCL